MIDDDTAIYSTCLCLDGLDVFVLVWAKNLFYRSISWTMHLLHAQSSAHSFPVRLSLQVPYRKTQAHQFIKATYHPKRAITSSWMMPVFNLLGWLYRMV
jgi:hypothetical protein